MNIIIIRPACRVRTVNHSVRRYTKRSRHTPFPRKIRVDVKVKNNYRYYMQKSRGYHDDRDLKDIIYVYLYAQENRRVLFLCTAQAIYKRSAYNTYTFVSMQQYYVLICFVTIMLLIKMKNITQHIIRFILIVFISGENNYLIICFFK